MEEELIIIPTKSLDEVIQAVKLCDMVTAGCHGCPYEQDEFCTQSGKDVLYYLEELRRIKEGL